MNTAEKLARQVLDSLTTGDVASVGDLVTEDFVDHGAPPWAPQGRAGYLTILTSSVPASRSGTRCTTWWPTATKWRYGPPSTASTTSIRSASHPPAGRTRCRPCTCTAPRA